MKTVSKTGREDSLDDVLMEECLKLAAEAIRLGEVPIAAVVARGDGASRGQIIGRGWNELIAKRDRTLHAEMSAMRDAAGRYPIDCEDLVLACTLEPCIMCAGAAYLCGISRIVYGLSAPADGGMGRISPPSSPETTRPSVVGPLREGEVVGLFEQWLKLHPHDRPQQEQFVRQLLEQTREG